jgi:methionyl aminopeptidase
MVIKKSPAEIEAMKEAGYLSALVLREIGALIEPGISTLELDNFAETFIRSHGGIPTFKGYGGFPGSICASVNDQIVHGIPSSSTILRDGDIISIDTGATVGGWVGDNAWTYPVGKVSPDVMKLLETTEKCMWAAISAARPGNRLGDVGYACQKIAEQRGYGVVREYVGHGVGRAMHEGPDVPNYGRRHHGIMLEPGMVIAIEPMVNMGTRKTRCGDDGWLVLTRDGKPSAHFEKTVAITEDGPILLTAEPDRKRPVSDQDVRVKA